MTTLEDRLREALAERAALSPVDPDAWDKAMARSRRGRLGRLWWQRPARTGLLVPAAAAAAVAAVIIAATTLAGQAGPGPKPPGPAASAPPTGPPLPADMSYLVRQIARARRAEGARRCSRSTRRKLRRR